MSHLSPLLPQPLVLPASARPDGGRAPRVCVLFARKEEVGGAGARPGPGPRGQRCDRMPQLPATRGVVDGPRPGQAHGAASGGISFLGDLRVPVRGDPSWE